jgi:hypothetical protein
MRVEVNSREAGRREGGTDVTEGTNLFKAAEGRMSDEIGIWNGR